MRSLKGIVTTIGTVVAVVTAVSLPAAYFAAGYSSLSQRLDFEAELKAGYLAKYVNGHPVLWQYQNVRIAEMLSQTDASDLTFRRRVVDSSNKTVLDQGGEAAAPSLTRRKSVLVAGSRVGYLELEASLRPLLQNTFLAALLSGLLGLGIFFSLRIFPLRVLDRTLGELERSGGALAQTNERFKAALTHMSHGLSMFDAEGRLVVNNDRFAAMYDVSPDVIRAGQHLRGFSEAPRVAGLFPGRPRPGIARAAETG